MVGTRLSAVARFSRRILPVSAGVLIGVALFFLLPELAEFFHWAAALGWFCVGSALLWTIDRYIAAVCPSCSHTHHHEDCGQRLHGFAAPLLIAAAVHSFLDGWAMASASQLGSETLGMVLVAGIALHKIPEGIALGVISRAALASVGAALAGCAAAESATIAGALLETALAPRIGTEWVHLLLALAGGAFLYLGYHAIHAEYRRGGARPALAPALTGVAGPAAIWLFGSSFGRLFG